MGLVDIPINLSMTRSEIIPVIRTVQGDTGRSIVATITDMTMPSGAAVKFFALKPSGKGIYNTATVSISDGVGKITAQLTNQTLAESGVIHAQFQITSSSKIVKTFCFDIINDVSLAGDYPASTNESTWLDSQVSEMQSKVNTAVSNAQSTVNKLETNVNTAVSNANTATTNANTAAASANAATTKVDNAISALDSASKNTLINDSKSSTLTTYSSNKVEDLLDDYLLTDDDVSDTMVAFTTPSTRQNLISQQTLGYLFGQIDRWLRDLKTAAFRNVANNLTTTSSGSYVLDAYQGKVLQNLITALESSISDVESSFVGEWEPYITRYTAIAAVTMTSGSTSNVVFIRTGNVVQFVVGAVSGFSTVGSDVIVGTIPDGYKPVDNYYTFYNGVASGSIFENYCGRWHFRTDGKIIHNTNTVATLERMVSGSWITADDYPATATASSE